MCRIKLGHWGRKVRKRKIRRQLGRSKLLLDEFNWCRWKTRDLEVCPGRGTTGVWTYDLSSPKRIRMGTILTGETLRWRWNNNKKIPVFLSFLLSQLQSFLNFFFQFPIWIPICNRPFIFRKYSIPYSDIKIILLFFLQPREFKREKENNTL